MRGFGLDCYPRTVPSIAFTNIDEKTGFRRFPIYAHHGPTCLPDLWLTAELVRQSKHDQMSGCVYLPPKDIMLNTLESDDMRKFSSGGSPDRTTSVAVRRFAPKNSHLNFNPPVNHLQFSQANFLGELADRIGQNWTSGVAPKTVRETIPVNDISEVIYSSGRFLPKPPPRSFRKPSGNLIICD